jgi:hypothetical protein
MPPPIEPIDVSTAELEALLEQARPSLSGEAYQKLRAAIRTLAYVTELLEKQGTSLAAPRELLCRASTEKTEAVLKQAGVGVGEKKHKVSDAELFANKACFGKIKCNSAALFANGSLDEPR